MNKIAMQNVALEWRNDNDILKDNRNSFNFSPLIVIVSVFNVVSYILCNKLQTMTDLGPLFWTLQKDITIIY